MSKIRTILRPAFGDYGIVQNGDTIYNLNPIDRVQSDVYVPWLLCYKFTGDFQQASQTIRSALCLTLIQYPILSGNLMLDDTGSVCVRVSKDSGTEFTVHSLPGDFPTFTDLVRSSFAPTMLAPEALLPDSMALAEGQDVNRLEESSKYAEKPAAAFQLNLLDGGIIIAVSIHHFLTDGVGLDTFLGQWAATARHMTAGMPGLAPFNPATTDRSPLAIHGALSAKTPEQLLDSLPQYHSSKNSDTALPPTSGVQFETGIFYISDDNLNALKSEVNPPHTVPIASQSFTSSNDAILALFWTCITRARAFDHPDMVLNTVLSSAVQFRGQSIYGIPDSYFGNSYVFGYAKANGQELVNARSGVLTAARAVRDSVQRAISEEHVQCNLALLAQQKDINSLSLSFQFFLGPDLATTSFKRCRLYQDADFGFGKPERFRLPKAAVDGLVAIHPQKCAGDGYEVTVWLELKCMHRLRHDAQLLQYMELRAL